MRHLNIMVILSCVVIFIACFSSPVAKKNAENIKKIQPGMTMEEVKKIMDEPDRIIIYPLNDKEYEFEYISPTGYSDYFRIFISRSDSIVLRIADGL